MAVRSDSVRSGMPVSQIASQRYFMMALIVATAMTHYSFPGRFMLLSEFPTDPDIRLDRSIDWCRGASIETGPC